VDVHCEINVRGVVHRRKAAEGCRSPRRFARAERIESRGSVVDCVSPLPLFKWGRFFAAALQSGVVSRHVL